MYIVSRKSDESVIIDGFSNPARELKVTVLEVKYGRVKLGIEVSADTNAHDPQTNLQYRDDIRCDHALAASTEFGVKRCI